MPHQLTTCLFVFSTLRPKEKKKKGKEKKHNVTISVCPEQLVQQSKCCLQFGKDGFMSGLKFER